MGLRSSGSALAPRTSRSSRTLAVFGRRPPRVSSRSVFRRWRTRSSIWTPCWSTLCPIGLRAASFAAQIGVGVAHSAIQGFPVHDLDCSPTSSLMRIFRGTVALQSQVVAVLRKRARRWAEGHEVDYLAASVTALLRRGDVPEALRYSALRIVCNRWVTSRRLSQESGLCRMGCGDDGMDWIEQYLYCPVLMPLARMHLRLDLAAVRARGVFGTSGYLGPRGTEGSGWHTHTWRTTEYAMGTWAERAAYVLGGSRRCRGGILPSGIGPRCHRGPCCAAFGRCDRTRRCSVARRAAARASSVLGGCLVISWVRSGLCVAAPSLLGVKKQAAHM